MKLKDQLLNAISFIFHPLIMPLLGVIFYFSKSPRFIPEPIIKAKVIALTILTIIVPLLLFYLLKLSGSVKSIYLKTVKERIRPLVLNCLVLLLAIKHIVPNNEIVELTTLTYSKNKLNKNFPKEQ